jgi:predicted nucleic acid-binding protein
LIDETAGRIEASRRGIRNTGTLGVLRAAALKDYVDLPTTLARLLETNFRVSMELVTALLAEDAERRQRHSDANQKPSE